MEAEAQVVILAFHHLEGQGLEGPFDWEPVPDIPAQVAWVGSKEELHRAKSITVRGERRIQAFELTSSGSNTARVLCGELVPKNIVFIRRHRPNVTYPQKTRCAIPIELA